MDNRFYEPDRPPPLPLPPFRLRSPSLTLVALVLGVRAGADGVAPEPAAAAPVALEADRLRSVPDGATVAEGHVRLTQGTTELKAERLSYQAGVGLVRAEGAVTLVGDSLRLEAPAAQLLLGTWEGWLQAPAYELPVLGTRGAAARVDLLGRQQFRAADASYTSCPRPSPGESPAWELVAREVEVDLAANEGRARGAKLRFQGVTLLAAPALSFPVTDERKSGWLPPSLNLDSRSGLDLSLPYYLNLAPNLDATLAPRVMTRRGLGLGSELRYLQPAWSGEASLDWVPYDRTVDRSRHALSWQHRQGFGTDWRLQADAIHVSDDDWWRDFPRSTPSLTPRLLPFGVELRRVIERGSLFGQAYVGARGWQVLQDADAPITSPYARALQLGLSAGQALGPLRMEALTELNRFVLLERDPADTRSDGWRWHGQLAVSWPFRPAGGWFVPRVALHASRYRTDQPMSDGSRSAERILPSFSLDTGLNFERTTEALFGRRLTQTLEPRLYYVQRPYRRQDQLPLFDSFGKEFNLGSIYADNPFAGQDRISDARQMTLGVTSRLLDPGSGAERLRLGIAQRYLMRSQQVAPALDGSPDGAPLTQSLSDLLLLASTDIVPHWSLDAALQYSPDSARLRRSVVGASYSPGPWRTLNLRYRLARGLSEQVEAGWQWPVYRAKGAGGPASGCRGTLYGVGRINYSMKDSRVTDSLLGLEYDSGCWIGRVVAERVSTGRSEATTRLMLQLELVGLSRLGSNPLKVLKDNIPGYRLLRDPRGGLDAASSP